MTTEQFLLNLQAHTQSFAKAVATNEGEWIVKGFIDVYRRIYTISVDTKDMAQALSLARPYSNLKSYLEYKNHGVDTLRAHEKEIVNLAEDEAGKTEEESE